MSREDKICYMILISVGLIIYLITFFVSKEFFLAKNKVFAETVLVNCEMSTEKRLKKKSDREADPLHKYYTCYMYELTWERENPVSHKKYRFTDETEDISPKSFEIGQKETKLIYYNDDESDYEFADPLGAVIFLAVGTLLIIIPVIDIIGFRKVRRAKQTAASQKNTHYRTAKQLSHSPTAAAVIVIKAGGTVFYAAPEKNTPAKMLVNMLSRGKIEVSFKESDNGEIFCQIPQRLSVSPSETAFSNGDIILYKDRMGIVCSEMKANAVKCAVIGNTHNKDLKDLFLNSPKVSLSVEWSE